ncbi:MAG: nicotinamide mononucleotide transporter [Ruminiclostridium sp.]|nr:nicotinamide mononucleotide transporter [Ruminiclostridium sp.]
MKLINRAFSYFTAGELVLWGTSVTLIAVSFIIFDKENILTLAASLLGVTSLIFCAKGNPAGQVLMVAFSIMYGIISYDFRYYGEMATYLGMTAPMAVLALISWLRNPYGGDRSQVKVNRLRLPEIVFMAVLTAAVTGVFYFILSEFGTANLLPSTLSVTTSFAAVYLTFRRSPYFALLYAMNDAVLIVLWVLAARENTSYMSVVICFVMFLANDIYGFISWRRMEKRQSRGE